MTSVTSVTSMISMISTARSRLSLPRLLPVSGALGWLLLAASPALAAPPESTPDTQPPAGLEGPQPVDVEPYEDPLLEALRPVSGGLTADEVARRAVEHSPEIAAKRAEITIAEAQLDHTLYQFIPHVEGTFTYTRLSQSRLAFGGDGGGFIVGALNEGPLSFGPCAPNSILQCVVDTGGIPVGATALDFGLEDPPLNSFSLQATLGVPISDYIARLPTAKKSGQAQIRASEYASEAELLTVQRDSRMAYYDWVRAAASRVALQESQVRTQARLEDAEAGFEAGLASKADVMRLDSAVATLTAAGIRAENFERLAQEMLATLMADEGFPDYQIGEDILTPKPPMDDADDLEALIAEAEQERLEMKAFDASTEALELGIKTTRAGYYPRLDGFAEATYANPNQRFFPLTQDWNGSWSAGLKLTWVLNDALQTKTKVRELQANKRALTAQREMLRRGLTLEVAAAHAERQSTLAELQYIDRATESATEGYRVAVDLFQVGDATTTDILDAEYERVSATLRSINAKIDLRIADLKLRYATGRLEPIATEVAPGTLP